MGGSQEAVLRDDRRTDTGADFAAWVQPHLAVLSALPVQQVGRSESADLVQETLLRAWQKRATFDDRRGSARGWLIAVMYDRARRLRTRAKPVPSVRAPSSGNVSAEQGMDIRVAIRSLPPRQRQIVSLHYVGGLTLAQVADTLRISVGATKSQLHDAKRALRVLLDSQEDR